MADVMEEAEGIKLKSAGGHFSQPAPDDRAMNGNEYLFRANTVA
jgi:hypothetical protein